MNSRIRAGTAKRSLQTFLIYVLRLRQAVSHPYLLESMVEDYFEDEDLQWLREQLPKAGEQPPFLAQIGRLCERKLEGRGVEAYVTHDNDNDDRPFGKGNFGRHFNIDPQLEMIQKKRAGVRVPCDSCQQVALSCRTEVCTFLQERSTLLTEKSAAIASVENAVKVSSKNREKTASSRYIVLSAERSSTSRLMTSPRNSNPVAATFLKLLRALARILLPAGNERVASGSPVLGV